MNKEENNFIFVTTDNEGLDGKGVSALEIVKLRLSMKYWPIYIRTPNKALMTCGDNILFYCAGKRQTARTIVASAKINNVHTCKANTTLKEHDHFLTDFPYKLIELGDIRQFQTTLDFREALVNLEMCPPNIKKWGSLLQGGVRKISKNDFSYFQNLANVK